MTETHSNYAPGSNFESCPAATGEASCTSYPDGAHRCRRPRDHVRSEHWTPMAERVNHVCTCNEVWHSRTGEL